MRLLPAVLAATLLLAAPALAKSHGSILSGTSLYAKAATTPPGQIKALCDEIIAAQGKSKGAMADAGQLYFQGKLMGQSCIKIDYAKALTLLKASGDTAQFNAILRLVRERAAAGNAAAAKAIKPYGTH